MKKNILLFQFLFLSLALLAQVKNKTIGIGFIQNQQNITEPCKSFELYYILSKKQIEIEKNSVLIPMYATQINKTDYFIESDHKGFITLYENGIMIKKDSTLMKSENKKENILQLAYNLVKTNIAPEKAADVDVGKFINSNANTFDFINDVSGGNWFSFYVPQKLDERDLVYQYAAPYKISSTNYAGSNLLNYYTEKYNFDYQIDCIAEYNNASYKKKDKLKPIFADSLRQLTKLYAKNEVPFYSITPELNLQQKIKDEEATQSAINLNYSLTNQDYKRPRKFLRWNDVPRDAKDYVENDCINFTQRIYLPIAYLCLSRKFLEQENNFDAALIAVEAAIKNIDKCKTTTMQKAKVKSIAYAWKALLFENEKLIKENNIISGLFFSKTPFKYNYKLPVNLYTIIDTLNTFVSEDFSIKEENNLYETNQDKIAEQLDAIYSSVQSARSARFDKILGAVSNAASVAAASYNGGGLPLIQAQNKAQNDYAIAQSNVIQNLENIELNANKLNDNISIENNTIMVDFTTENTQSALAIEFNNYLFSTNENIAAKALSILQNFAIGKNNLSKCIEDLLTKGKSDKEAQKAIIAQLQKIELYSTYFYKRGKEVPQNILVKY